MYAILVFLSAIGLKNSDIISVGLGSVIGIIIWVASNELGNNCNQNYNLVERIVGFVVAKILCYVKNQKNNSDFPNKTEDSQYHLTQPIQTFSKLSGGGNLLNSQFTCYCFEKTDCCCMCTYS